MKSFLFYVFLVILIFPSPFILFSYFLFHEQRELECPFFSWLKKSAQNDSRKVGIDRKPMLYNSTPCKSLFARQRILNEFDEYVDMPFLFDR